MFWIILGVVLVPIQPQNTVFCGVFWQLIPAENGQIIYVTMPIAIATDQRSYSPIIGWRHRVLGALWGVGNRAIQLYSSQINCTVAPNGKV